MSDDIKSQFHQEVRASGLSAEQLSDALPVDVVTAQRWIDGTTVPRPRMMERVRLFLAKDRP